MLAFAQGSAVPTDAQSTAVESTSSKIQTYEIVSIKPNKTGNSSGGMWFLPDGIELRNLNLYFLVRGAYGIILDSQVSGLPEWARSESYDYCGEGGCCHG
jgi:hypothetical protein